jgi:hypothetical protein
MGFHRVLGVVVASLSLLSSNVYAEGAHSRVGQNSSGGTKCTGACGNLQKNLNENLDESGSTKAPTSTSISSDGK